MAVLTRSDDRLRWRLGATPRDSGLRLDGWFVWCGAAIAVADTWHLFASRWPEASGFPDGYREHSEIVRATASSPLGPYTLQEVVLGPRGGDSWDGGMTHNPVIHRFGDRYLLFYIGSRAGSRQRAIGLATADAITGPWRRPDRPLDLGVASDANNPAALFEADGRTRLLWRTERLRACISVAPRPEGPYRLVNEDLWPEGPIEDFSWFTRDGRFHLLCEDNGGTLTGQMRWGARLVSDDGLRDWRRFEAEPVAYDHIIRFTDGGLIRARRRERPWLLIEDGAATALFTGVWDGERAWNQPVPIAPPWPGLGGTVG